MSEMIPVEQLGKMYLLAACASGCNPKELIVVPPDDEEPKTASAGCFFCGELEDANTITEAIEKWNSKQKE